MSRTDGAGPRPQLEQRVAGAGLELVLTEVERKDSSECWTARGKDHSVARHSLSVTADEDQVRVARLLE